MSLFSDNNVSDPSTANVQISDDCTTLRINELIFQKDSSASVSPFYALDTTNMTWAEA